MARRATKSRTITVDFEGVDSGGGGFHIPEGEYGVKVESVDLKKSDNGNDMIAWTFVGTEGKAKGKKFYLYTVLVEQALWKLRGTLEGLGVEVPDSSTDIDLDELVGLEGTGLVEDNEYEGRIRSQLVSIISSDEEEEVDDKKNDKKNDKKGGKKKELVKFSEAEIKDMNEDELEEVIEKCELSVDLSIFKILGKKRTAVINALTEAELIEE